MTLVIKPGVRLRQQLPADAEADAYIAAVEAADGQALEPGVKFAIKNFVLCCKQDGIWNAIKASCILAGARTLNGALVPLAGTAPTNFNFVSGDYNRKTGLVGNGTTKYLSSNRNNNADPQDSKHIAVMVTTPGSSVGSNIFPCYMGAGLNLTGATNLGVDTVTNTIYRRLNTATGINALPGTATGLIGLNRSNSAGYSLYRQATFISTTTTSQTPFNGILNVFQDNTPGTQQASNARLSFYSIGESLDLALLDARVTDLMNAIGVAIP